jgi:hypothetical protein
VRATEQAAWMFDFCASMPRMRLLLPASCDAEGRKGRGEMGSVVEDRSALEFRFSGSRV